MKTPKLILTTLSALLLTSISQAGEEVDRLLEGYSKIETVTCQVRRTKEGPAGKMKFLSRVYYTNKDQLHAEGISPIKRRTIADGERLYQYVEGDPKGFSRPISVLSEQMAISLRLVPGTAMDHLLRLKGLDETTLPSEDSAKRVGLQTENKFVVLLFDDQDRLIGIDFFKTTNQNNKIASYTYQDFAEPVAGVWVPFTHKASIYGDGVQFDEVVKVDRFIANKPVAQSLFIPASFFDKTVDFVDDFAKIFPEQKE